MTQIQLTHRTWPSITGVGIGGATEWRSYALPSQLRRRGMSIFPRLLALLRLAGLALIIAVPAPASAGMLNGVICDGVDVQVTEVNGATSLLVNVDNCELGAPFPNAVCGDGFCNGSETCNSCAEDNCCTPQPTPRPTPAPTPQPDGSCPDGILETPTRDGWIGLLSVTIPPGVTKRYCADVSGQVDRLNFEAVDLSNRNCAKAEMTVQQQNGNQWARSSGLVGSPWINASAIISRSKRDYLETAPGRYYISVTGHDAASDCQRFQIDWRPY